MEFRKATAGDVDDLVQLRKRQLVDEGLSALCNIDSELTAYFENGLSTGAFVAWVAVDNGEIVATGGLCFYQLPPTYANPSGKVAYVTNMFTAQPYRRRGIASALLKKVLSEVRCMGYTSARLHASCDGKGLYKRFGFIETEGHMAIRF